MYKKSFLYLFISLPLMPCADTVALSVNHCSRSPSGWPVFFSQSCGWLDSRSSLLTYGREHTLNSLSWTECSTAHTAAGSTRNTSAKIHFLEKSPRRNKRGEKQHVSGGIWVPRESEIGASKRARGGWEAGEEFLPKWKQTGGRYFPFIQQKTHIFLRNYEEPLDDINPRLDSFSFGRKGEFRPRTIRELLAGSWA